MAEERPRTPAPHRRSPLLFLLAVGLALAVAWLLAERNARQWWLVPEDGKVAVKKGVLFVAGKATFKSADPEMSRTYAPVTPPPGAAPVAEASFDDRAALDQALFEMLAGWAREDVRSEQMDRMERARAYLARAARLAGISASQRDQLRALQAETAFQEGADGLRSGAESLRRALESMRLAAGAQGPVAAEADAIRKALEPVAASAGQLMLEASRFAAERYRTPPRTDGKPGGDEAPAPGAGPTKAAGAGAPSP
jgi:hypothetical protein